MLAANNWRAHSGRGASTSQAEAASALPGVHARRHRRVAPHHKCRSLLTGLQQTASATHHSRTSTQQRFDSVVTGQDLEDAKSIFSSLLYEYEYWVDEAWVEGAIPPDLEGTYFRNGPGLQVQHPGCQRHPFDGDGMVLSLAFKGGRAFFRNKFVRTKGFVEEQAAGKPLYRCSFTRGAADGSPLFNPLDLAFKNTANTGVVHLGGELLALYEIGLPHRLDPHTLETLGESTMGGQLLTDRLAGHFRWISEPDPDPDLHPAGPDLDPITGSSSNSSTGSSSRNHNHHKQQQQQRLVTFSTKVGLQGSQVYFYEFDSTGRRVACSTHQLGQGGVDITFVHDLLVTPSYYVLVLGPVQFDLARFFTEYMLGRKSVAECMAYDPGRKTRIMLFPRPRPGPATAATAGHARQAGSSSEGHGNGSSCSSSVAAGSGGGGSSIGDCTRCSRYCHSTASCHGSCSLPGAAAVAGTPSSSSAWSSSQSSSAPAAPPGTPPKGPIVLETVPFFAFHHINAFEVEGAGTGGAPKVVIDTIGWGDIKFDVNHYNVTPDHFVGGCRSEYYRLVADLGSREVAWGRMLRRTVEFPALLPGAVAGRPQRVAFMVADEVDHDVLWGPARWLVKVCVPPSKGVATPLQGSQDVTTESWAFPPRCYPGEPTFVPRPSQSGGPPGGDPEQDGWVVVMVHNAGAMKGEVHIFDAARISAGPLCKIHLPHQLPAGLHGSFSPTYLGPDPSAPGPRWSAPHRIRSYDL